MKTQVRKVLPGDIPAVVAIWREFMTMLADTNPDYWDGRRGAAAFSAHLEAVLSSTDALAAVAETDGHIAGFALARVEALPEWFDTRIGLIRYLAVSPDARGLGVGKALFDAVVQWFRSQDIERVELYVLDGLPASGFWDRMGFKRFMERRFLNV